MPTLAGGARCGGDTSGSSRLASDAQLDGAPVPAPGVALESAATIDSELVGRHSTRSASRWLAFTRRLIHLVAGERVTAAVDDHLSVVVAPPDHYARLCSRWASSFSW